MIFTKKSKKDSFNLVKTGIVLGTMSSLDSSAAPLSKAVKYGGSMMAAGMVIDSVNYLQKKTKRYMK